MGHLLCTQGNLVCGRRQNHERHSNRLVSSDGAGAFNGTKHTCFRSVPEERRATALKAEHTPSAQQTRDLPARKGTGLLNVTASPPGRNSAPYKEGEKRVPLTCSNLAFQASLAKGPWPTMTRRVQILRKSRPSAQSWYSRNTGLSSTGTRSGMTTSSSKRRPTSSGTAPSHRVSSRAALAEMTAQV
jgi:hypothetical protein